MKKTLLAFMLCVPAFGSYSLSFIEGNIRRLNPYMHPEKVASFAAYIRDASDRYEIDPSVLVAISFQESSFRENLPEGPAGELGVCQIQKYWVYDPRFVREFGRVTFRKLSSTRFNYLVAAWILDQARNQYGDDAVTPFWTYYNSAILKYRLAYFKRVVRHLSKLSLLEVHTPIRRIRRTHDPLLYGYFPKEDGPGIQYPGTSGGERRGNFPGPATCSQGVPARSRRVQRG